MGRLHAGLLGYDYHVVNREWKYTEADDRILVKHDRIRQKFSREMIAASHVNKHDNQITKRWLQGVVTTCIDPSRYEHFSGLCINSWFMQQVVKKQKYKFDEQILDQTKEFKNFAIEFANVRYAKYMEKVNFLEKKFFFLVF